MDQCCIGKPKSLTRRDRQRRSSSIGLINQLNGELGSDAGSELSARAAAYELAFRMQAHAPEVVDIERKTALPRRPVAPSTSMFTA